MHATKKRALIRQPTEITFSFLSEESVHKYTYKLKGRVWINRYLVTKMPSEAEEVQLTQVRSTLTEFVRILVKEYPLVFKDDSGVFKVHASVQFFPYEVSMEITKKE